ncbi:MAG: phosphotransferase family protein [Gammaproteobacteria bacterium]|nr:phosphotransferase family protein [Gammaproteobacteria bacterium]
MSAHSRLNSASPSGRRSGRLGDLAALDPVALGFGDFTDIPTPADCARRELDYWAGVIEADQIHPQPVAAAAIRWLRANMPPPAQKLSIVHGDYRTGNFLFSPDEGIKGILDWEMCHVGDPLEDLAWSFDPLWSWGEPELAGRLLPRSEAIGIWEAASGLAVDRRAFRWWQIFASLKGLAIWISSSEDFDNGESKDAILAYAGWVMTDRQNRILTDYLSPLAEAGLRGDSTMIPKPGSAVTNVGAASYDRGGAEPFVAICNVGYGHGDDALERACHRTRRWHRAAPRGWPANVGVAARGP